MARAAAERRTIRKIDFRNGFIYRGGYGPIVVRQGEFTNDSENGREYFEVLDVDYGDLDGDGVEEAVVTTLNNTGGTGQFTDGLVFALRSGKPRVVANVGVGDRADGGLYDVSINENLVIEERYGQQNSGACCPEYVERTKLALRNAKLVRVGTPAKRAYIDITRGSAGAPVQIRFLKGGNSATVVGLADGTATGAFFSASAGQTARILVRPPRLAKEFLTVTLRQNGERVGAASSGGTWSAKLPVTGTYDVVLSAPRSDPNAVPFVSFELEIR